MEPGGNYINSELNKYQVTISFEMDEHFMSYVPSHRVYINGLIDKGVIDYYSVSMETMRCWMVINAADKKEVESYLNRSPLFKYWTFEIDELFVYDGQTYRLPAVQLN
jgi:muconolactone delta-isomerase